MRQMLLLLIANSFIESHRCLQSGRWAEAKKWKQAAAAGEMTRHYTTNYSFFSSYYYATTAG